MSYGKNLNNKIVLLYSKNVHGIDHFCHFFVAQLLQNFGIKVKICHLVRLFIDFITILN